jgi:hypothetical protein
MHKLMLDHGRGL